MCCVPVPAGKAGGIFNRVDGTTSTKLDWHKRGAASTIGRCRKNDLVTFAASTRGVEDYCAAHSGLGAFFDEEGRALGTLLKSQTRTTSNSRGRGRASPWWSVQRRPLGGDRCRSPWCRPRWPRKPRHRMR
jgi:hypothetical protein